MNSNKISFDSELVKNAMNGNWEDVNRLLEAGEKPLQHRLCDGPNRYSALYFALQQKNHLMATRLYDAGDRLDDLHVERDILSYLAYNQAFGRNFFAAGNHTLSECVRLGLVREARQKVRHAEPEELNAAAGAILDGFCRFPRAGVCFVRLLKRLLKAGADIAPCRRELLADIKRWHEWPQVMQENTDMESLVAIEELIRKA